MKKIKYEILRYLFKTTGRLSTGIDMSFRYGLISGEMLDYIYQNKANGRLFIGRIFDRLFLNNVGWQAVRQRKANLKKYIKAAVEKNRERNKKTVIIDFASGPARYLVESISETGEKNVSVVCSDLDERWLKKGSELAKEAGLKNFKFMKGNAFDLKFLSKIRPKPNVIVSSGFYDWIVDDKLIKKSLTYSYKMLPKEGIVIFTNQVGHRQMELVSEVFIDFNKEPLSMKTRPSETLNKWAEEIGFKKLETVTDKWELYSVTWGNK